MDLGNFSLSLSVKDITASREFYEKLGFHVFAGEQDQGWLIMKGKNCVIGLFQGMFEKNTLTFNPGWNDKGETLDSFEDIRAIQNRLKSEGLKLETEVDETTTGPASFMLLDPDGNPILFDQHV